MNFRVEYVRPLSGRCLGREAAERATKSTRPTDAILLSFGTFTSAYLVQIALEIV